MYPKTIQKKIENLNILILIRDTIRVSLLASFLFICGFNILEIILSGFVGLIMASNSNAQRLNGRMEKNRTIETEIMNAFTLLDNNEIEAEQSPHGHFNAWNRISGSQTSDPKGLVVKHTQVLKL